MTPNALYTFVSCNKFGVRDKLCERSQSVENVNDNIRHEGNICDSDEEGTSMAERREDLQTSNTTQMVDSTVSESILNLNNIGGISRFIVTIPKEEFISMIVTKKYKRTEKHKSALNLYANIPCCSLDYGNIFSLKKYGKPQKYLVNLISNVTN